MKRVIIAEKPSVARNIADALQIKQKYDRYYEGDHYIITWAFGHLLELYDAADYDAAYKRWKLELFPFIPERFRYKVKQNRTRTGKDANADQQCRAIRQLVQRKDVEAIISATDYDREGQIIADIVLAHCQHGKPVYRLLLNEWTEREVQRGLQKLVLNSEMKPLSDAGISRQWIDWIIGINLTSVATLKYQQGGGRALNVGRVLFPTLKIIYDRDRAIAEFKPEPYYKAEATFTTARGDSYCGTYEKNDEQKFPDRAKLAEELATITGPNVVESCEREKKKEWQPYLFNLTNLQGHMTKAYNGWTADKVLKVAQSLYEKKLITYPRTASTVLEESLVDKVRNVFETHKQGLPYEAELTFHTSKRLFNTAKVDSHSAITPTYAKPKSLTGDEKLVYDAIFTRFFMQFMPVAEFEETTIVTNVAPLVGRFMTKGKRVLQLGWKQLLPNEQKETHLPYVERGEAVQLTDCEITDHMTTAPKRHTEQTLLRSMETCGKHVSEDEVETVLTGYSIGTPATRADTIKKLKDIGYIEQRGKEVICTALGVKLVETFPIPELFDLNFTGKLEKALADIEKKQTTREQFLQYMFDFTKYAVETIKQHDVGPIHVSEASGPKKPVFVGKCPKCGGGVMETQKAFGCNKWQEGCKFTMWKNDSYLAAFKKKLTKAIVTAILKNGYADVKKLTSKAGKQFDARLYYEEKDGKYGWRLEFTEGEKKA